MHQFCPHPDFDPSFLLFLIKEGILHHYIHSNYLLPVSPDKVLTLPIEVHLDLIKPEVAAKSQKIIMMGPQTTQNETQESNSPAGGINNPLEMPVNSHAGGLQQEQEQEQQQQQQQQQQCNNGMDFQQPYHQPQPYAQGAYIPMDNMYQQQPAAAQNFMPMGMPNMPNFGMPPPNIYYGQHAPTQQQQQQQSPPPFNGPHPTTTENPNAYIYITMHSEFLFRVMQQMFSQFAPNFQQQQAHQMAQGDNAQSSSYAPNTEPVTPLNK